MTVTLELDEALDLIIPSPGGEKTPQKRPDASARALFFGEEAGIFRDTRLTLVLRSGEDEVHISSNAHGVHPGALQLKAEGDVRQPQLGILLQRDGVGDVQPEVPVCRKIMGETEG